MTEILLARLKGQHVYRITDDAQPLYKSLGFKPQGIGVAKVIGEWLAR